MVINLSRIVKELYLVSFHLYRVTTCNIIMSVLLNLTSGDLTNHDAI